MSTTDEYSLYHESPRSQTPCVPATPELDPTLFFDRARKRRKFYQNLRKIKKSTNPVHWQAKKKNIEHRQTRSPSDWKIAKRVLSTLIPLCTTKTDKVNLSVSHSKSAPLSRHPPLLLFRRHPKNFMTDSCEANPNHSISVFPSPSEKSTPRQTQAFLSRFGFS